MAKDDEQGSGEQEQRVPLTRLNQVLQEKKDAEQRAAELAKRVEALEAAQQPDEQLQTQFATLQTNFEKLQSDLAAERMTNLRQRAAAAAQLNVEKYAGRLQGDTYEALVADAQSIAEDLKPASPGQLPPPNGDPVPAITAQQLNDPQWVRENMDKVWQQAVQN